MLEWIPFANLQQVIQWGGLLLLVCIIFAESGLFVGFFLPGDSLLFTAGLLAAAGLFDIRTLIVSLVLAAIAGDQVGFWTGRYLGSYLQSRQDGRFYKKKYLDRAHKFYEAHGVMAIILARFIPVIRTFAPIVAGGVAMSYRKFITYNIIGGVLWVSSMVGAGYLLVKFIPGIERYLHMIILLIIVLSLVPIAREYYEARHA